MTGKPRRLSAPGLGDWLTTRPRSERRARTRRTLPTEQCAVRIFRFAAARRSPSTRSGRGSGPAAEEAVAVEAEAVEAEAVAEVAEAEVEAAEAEAVAVAEEAEVAAEAEVAEAEAVEAAEAEAAAEVEAAAGRC